MLINFRTNFNCSLEYLDRYFIFITYFFISLDYNSSMSVFWGRVGVEQ